MTHFEGPAGDPAGYGPPPGHGTPPPAGYGLPPGYGPPLGGGAPGAPPPPRHQQDVSDASLAHYLGLLGWLGPLIILLTKGDQSPHVRAHAVEALNFHISMGIYSIAAVFLLSCLAFFTFGISLFGLFVPMVLSVVFSIMGGNAAKQGAFYRYPLAIRMISR